MHNITKRSKILISLFAVAFVSLTIHGFFVFQNKNVSNQKTPSDDDLQTEQFLNDEKANTQAEVSSPAAELPATSPTDPLSDSNDLDDEETPVAIEKNNYLDVSKTDCNNNCKDFSDPEDLEYCQQICGISVNQKNVTEKKGCDKFSGLEKDYCLKDLAIKTQNIKLCTQILDSDVEKVCKNHLAQDLLEAKN